MEFEYVVHSVNSTTGAAKVMYEGMEVDAQIQTLEVELIPPHGATHGGGSITLRLKGKNLAEARAAFVPNKVGTLTWAPGDAWAAGKEPDAPVVDGPHADPDQSEDAQRSRAGAGSTEEHAQE